MNNLFKKEISSWKAITIIAVLGILVTGFVLASTTGWNIMSQDKELVRLANKTQGMTSWQDPISANAGDQVEFLVYYHCGTNDAAWSTIKANNTKVRLNFPTTQATSIISTGRLSANNLSTITNTGTINVSSSQKLNFETVAVWYYNGASHNITATIGSGYIEVNLGNLDCDPMDCYDKAGFVVFKATVSSIFSAPTVDLKINNQDGTINVTYNTAATLSWTSTNATSCTASGDWSGSKAISGSQSTGNLTSSKSYTITCTGPGGSVSDSVGATVQVPQPTVDLKINGSDGTISVVYNTAATLSWTSTNVTSCTASGDWSGSKAISGSESTGSLTSNKTYTITCTGPGGSVSDSVGVNVQVSPPTVNLKANGSDGPITINYNTAATLSWTTTNNPTTCTASGDWSGSKAVLGGSQSTGILTLTKNYILSCSNSAGSASDSVLVQVLHCLPSPAFPPL